MVGRIGFEPMTNGLKARALPAELTTQISMRYFRLLNVSAEAFAAELSGYS